ncbi:MAG: methionyl-tRNA formyltransferase [Fimbriimonadales bacterium]
MRLAYFGTSSFAVPALEALAPNVELVVTQPSRPSGRGNLLVPTPVGLMALSLGIVVLSPDKARDAEFVSGIESRHFDALVVASYGQILSERLLAAAKYGGINLHGSVLPKYRGAAPIARAMLAGETETGVTLMQMDKGMDSGAIIAIETLEIGPDETAGELEARLADLAGEMAAAWLPRILKGEYPKVPQDHDKATLAPKLSSGEGLLRFTMSAANAYRSFRAFTPRPGAFFETSQGRLKLLRCSVSADSGEPGSVLGIGPEGLRIAMAVGALILTEVQPAGKKSTSWNDFANGWRLKEGDSLKPRELPTV